MDVLDAGMFMFLAVRSIMSASGIRQNSGGALHDPAYQAWRCPAGTRVPLSTVYDRVTGYRVCV